MLTDKSSRNAVLAAVCAAFLIAASAVRAEDSWPDLSKSAGAVGGGERDAAVIVGAENYAFVEHVPGAKQNANDWQEYLTETLKVPADRVALLLDNDATNDAIRQAAVEKASQVEEGGTLWFVFIGHGAPSKDGNDGLLVGVDAQQKASSVYSRSFSRNELLGILAKGKQAKTVVLIDACFSGKSPSGAALVAGLQPLLTMRALPLGIDSRTILMTAAKSDQFAGPLPGGARPAFSYLALGGLRGWAADAQGKVTASRLVDYIRGALTLSRDRTQTPELSTPETASVVLGIGREAGPDLSKLQRAAAAAGGSSPGFKVTNLPALPAAEAPKELSQAASGLDLSSVDVDSLEKYDGAVKFEKGGAAPGDKATTWRQLAKDAPKFADLAGKRAQEWDRFAAQKQAAAAAREKRIEARDADWKKLGRLLNLEVVSEADKTEWSAQFLKAYWKSPSVEPSMAQGLVAHVPEGPVRAALKKLALKAQEEDTMSSSVLKHLQATQAYTDLNKMFQDNKGKTGWLDGEAGRAVVALRDSMLADAAAVTTPKDKTDKDYGLLVIQINGKTRAEDGISLEDLLALNKKGEFKNPEYRDVISDAVAQDIVAGHSDQLTALWAAIRGADGPAGARVDDKALQSDGRSDRDFHVELHLSRVKYVQGDDMKLTVTATRDCSVYLYRVFGQGSNSKTALVVPNEAAQSTTLKAGETWEYPDGSAKKRLFAELPKTDSVSAETFVVVATKTPLPSATYDPTDGGYLGVFRRLHQANIEWAEDAAAYTIYNR